MSLAVIQVIVNDQSDRIITGVWTYDRDNGGVFIGPSGVVFPSVPVAGEWFWRIDERKLYRRNDSNTGWDSVLSDVGTHGSTHISTGSDPIPDVVASGASGLMSGADKLKLDNLSSTPQSAVLSWGNFSIGTTISARYLTPGFGDTIAPTSPTQFRIPRAGMVKNLYVHHNVTGGGTINITYTVRKNGVNQTVSTIVSADAADGSDTSNSFSVVAGDLLDVVITKASAITTSPVNVVASVELI